MLKAPENAGIIVTESYAMVPTAAVSGFYFSHPEADYFAVGKMARIRWKIMRSAKAGHWRKQKNGWRRFWHMKDMDKTLDLQSSGSNQGGSLKAKSLSALPSLSPG